MNGILQLFKPKSKFSRYKIELHQRYGGTFMLFGFSEKQQKWLLLEESRDSLDAWKWSQERICNMPDDLMKPIYCECCRR